MSRTRRLSGRRRVVTGDVLTAEPGSCQETQVLAARCELRRDYRHLRLDRVRGVGMLAERMPRRSTAMFREWRDRECIPAEVAERDFA